MAATYGIKLPQESPSAKAISTVRKATGLSLSEIKTRAVEGQYMLECDCSDDETLSAIIGLYKELGEEGIEAKLFWHGNPDSIEAKLFWHGNPDSIEAFENILASHEDTAKEVGFTED